MRQTRFITGTLAVLLLAPPLPAAEAPPLGFTAVLDSRLIEKAYGRRFLASLPPARLVHDLAEVGRFFAPD